MNYTKPQITLVGSACDLIEDCNDKTSCTTDGEHLSIAPAYDLDE